MPSPGSWSSNPLGAQVWRPPRMRTAPLSRVVKICSSAVSKPSAATCSTRSVSRRPYASAALVSENASERWLTRTPLGAPVVPEVYIR